MIKKIARFTSALVYSFLAKNDLEVVQEYFWEGDEIQETFYIQEIGDTSPYDALEFVSEIELLKHVYETYMLKR
jgi:hypothetical protein